MKKKKNDNKDFKGFEGDSFFQEEFVHSTPRASVILGAATIEILLERLLESFLIEDKNEIDKLISSDSFNAPLGTFSSKIRACYCLGLISRSEFLDLLKIKEIRNIFAHHINDCTFDNHYIKKICEQLILPPKLGAGTSPPRKKFTILVYCFEVIFKSRIKEIAIQKRTIFPEVRFPQSES